MKTRIALLSLFALCLTLAAVPAMAQCPGYCYDNGPVNGQVDAWTINFGFAVSDTFHLTAETDIQQLSFWAWVEPGDTVTSVEVAIGVYRILFEQRVRWNRYLDPVELLHQQLWLRRLRRDR